MNALNDDKTIPKSKDNSYSQWEGELKHYFSSEIFWRSAFDLMRMAIESSMNPLISRQQALRIIPRRSIDNAVKTGKLKPIKHGRYIFFDRICFYEFCKLGGVDIY